MNLERFSKIPFLYIRGHEYLLHCFYIVTLDIYNNNGVNSYFNYIGPDSYFYNIMKVFKIWFIYYNV